ACWSGRWSSTASPSLIVIGVSSNFYGTPIDLVRRLAKLVLTDMAQRYSVLAKFLLPGWRIGKGDQITRPLVQLGQCWSRLGAVDIPPDLPKHLPHAGLVVNFAVDMSVFTHKGPLNHAPLRLGGLAYRL